MKLPSNNRLVDDAKVSSLLNANVSLNELRLLRTDNSTKSLFETLFTIYVSCSSNFFILCARWLQRFGRS